jgi:hypothetical protein
VHPNHAIVSFESAPSTASDLSIECLIGEVVAVASIVIAVALDERRNGGLTGRTKLQGADLIAQLYTLRQTCPDTFDVIARREGKRALHARYAQAKGKMNGSCPPFSEAIADTMVNWPLNALADIIRAEMN